LNGGVIIMGSTFISMDAFMEGCLALYVVFSSLFVAALFVTARRQRRSRI